MNSTYSSEEKTGNYQNVWLTSDNKKVALLQGESRDAAAKLTKQWVGCRRRLWQNISVNAMMNTVIKKSGFEWIWADEMQLQACNTTCGLDKYPFNAVVSYWQETILVNPHSILRGNYQTLAKINIAL